MNMKHVPTFGVVLFHTSSAALRAEKKLIEDGLSIKLIPTPRELSSNCGIALRFNWNQADRVHVLLDDAHLESEGIHRLGK